MWVICASGLQPMPCVDALLQNDQDKRGAAGRHSAATATFFHTEMPHTTWLKVKKDTGVLMLGDIVFLSFSSHRAALGLTLSCADFILKCHRAEGFLVGKNVIYFVLLC